MNIDYDVAVVGAGPIGLATAVLLARQSGFRSARVAVFDRRIPDPIDRVRRTSHRPARVRAVARQREDPARRGCLGGYRGDAQPSPIERMQVWHADVPPHGGDALVFDAAEIGERDLGVIAENTCIAGGAGRRRAPRRRRSSWPAMSTALDQERDAVVLHAGERQIRARLVVGADGAQSRVRELAGHGGHAHRLRPDRHRRHGEHRARRMNTPRGSDFSATARWRSCRCGTRTAPSCGRCQRRAPRRLLAATPAAFERELEKDFDGALGKVQLASERLKFPLWRPVGERIRHRRAWRWWATPRTWCIRWRGRARISGC